MKKLITTTIVAAGLSASVLAQGVFTVDNIGNANTSPTATTGGLFFIDTGTGPVLMDATYLTLNATVYAGSSSADALANGFVGNFQGASALGIVDLGVYSDSLGGTYVAHNTPLNGTATMIVQVWLGPETTFAAAQAANDYLAQATFTNPTGTTVGNPPPTPPNFANMPAMILTAVPVPEPSTFALAGLGLASLLIFRRRA